MSVSDMLLAVKSREIQRGMSAAMSGDAIETKKHFLPAAHHLQQARAISAYHVRVQIEFGGTDDARLIPLLACLIELLPWLKQWHNEPDAAFNGMRMGDYFEGFNEEARQLNKTLPEIKAWTPPAKTGRRGRRSN